MLAGWKEVKIKDIKLSIIDGDRGVNYPKQNDFVEEGYCLFLNTGNVKKDGFSFDKVSYITQEKDNKLRNGKLLREDIVLTTRGTVGNIAYYNCKIPFENVRINSGMVIIRNNINKDLNTSFLHQYLKSPMFGKQVNQFKYGAAQPQLPIGTLNHIKILIPPLEIQKKIAKILSNYDDLIENNLKRIKLLEEKAQQTYEEWFVRMKFPNHENTPIDKTTGLPLGWRQGRIKDLIELQRGFDLPTRLRQLGGVPVCASTGIVGYHNEFKVVGAGVVTGRSGTLGLVQYVDSDFWPLNTALWVKKYKNCKPIYVLHLLRSVKLERFGGGSAVPSLDRKVVHAQPVIIPNSDVISAFDKYGDTIFSEISNLIKQNKKLKEARDFLLPRLMTGIIDVGNLSSNV